MERVELDLSTPEGVETFMGLAEDADVVIESFRPGVMAKLGIGYDDVKARNPGIVYCSTTGYGQDGPRAQWAGHDLNYLAVGGFLDCSGRGPDGRPPIPGATVADSAGGGMNAVIGILAALVQRAGTGEGAYLDVSAADGVLALMALQVDEHLATGAVPGPGHGILTGRYACYGIYGCADGKWLTVAAIEPKFWANVCRALGLEQWLEHQLDDAAQDDIRTDMERVFRTRTRDDWCAELAPADTCVAPVLSVPELVEDAQFNARNAFVSATDDEHGEFRQVGWVLAGSGVEP
jgi:alpha-methylacyl-CoA racemase